MDTKLTLKLDQAPIEQANGNVGELAGVLKGLEVGDVRADYVEYLAKKYSGRRSCTTDRGEAFDATA